MDNMLNVTLLCYYEDSFFFHLDILVLGKVYIVFLLHLINYGESGELRGYVIMLLDNYFTYLDVSSHSCIARCRYSNLVWDRREIAARTPTNHK